MQTVERFGREYVFPDEATEAQINAYVAKDQATRRGKGASGGVGTYLKGLGRTALQGVTLGFGDEALARARSLGEPTYEQAVGEERGAVERFRQENPGTAIAAELAGTALPLAASVFVPPLRGPAGAQAARTGTGALSALSRFFARPAPKAAVTGGALGAVSGYGAAEGDAEEQAAGIAKGTAWGAGLGAALPAVGRAVKPAYDAIAGRLWPSLTDQVGKGREAVLRALGRDEVTLDDVWKRLAADRKVAVPSTLADASEGTTSLAETVASYPGKETARLSRELAERSGDQRERVARQVDWRLGRKQHQSGDFYDTEQGMLQMLRQNANDSYRPAYNAAPAIRETPKLTELLDRPVAKSAWADAIELAEIEGRKLGAVDATGRLRGVSLEAMDDFKRGIDSLIDKETDDLTGKMTKKGGALVGYKRQFMTALDEALPDDARQLYNQARMTYKGDKEVLDALRYGREQAHREAPEVLQRALADMSEAERDAFRQGFARRLADQALEPSQNVDAAKRLVNSPRMRQRLEVAFEDPQQRDLFLTALERESQLQANAGRVTGNSRTQRRQLAQRDFEGDPSGGLDLVGDAASLATGNTYPIVSRVLRFFREKLPLNEQRANEVARLLRAGTPAEVDDALTQLEAQAGRTAAREAASAANTQRAAVGAGVTAGTPLLPEEEEEPFGFAAGGFAGDLLVEEIGRGR